MNLSCKDRDQVLIDGTAEQWAALRLHAAACRECARELQTWEALSSAAAELREYQNPPELWSRIEASLVATARKPAGIGRWWASLWSWQQIPAAWQMGLAGACVLVLTFAAGYLALHRVPAPELAHNGFLADRALKEVERTESEYMKAIDKLALEAKPQLDASSSPLLASYQEKLLVLDGAIDELREQAGRNPSNAHLRYQLLAMYRDKQATLQDILETK